MVETTQDTIDAQTVFGTLLEWWNSEEKERAFSPHLSNQQWNDALKRTGFSGLDANVCDRQDLENHAMSVFMSTAVIPAPPTFNTPVDIVLGLSEPPNAWLETLKESIATATGLMPEVNSIDKVKLADKVYLVLADIDEAIFMNMDQARYNIIREFISRAKGVFWISRGGAVSCQVPERSLHSGLLRTLRHESRIHRYTTLDLDPNSPPWTVGSAGAIMDVFRIAFNYDVDMGPVDFEYAERGSVIHVLRFSNDPVENDSISDKIVLTPETLPYHESGREFKLGGNSPACWTV